MDEMVKLGLRGAVPGKPAPDGALDQNLADRLLGHLGDHAPDNDPDDVATFKASLTRLRAELSAPSPAVAVALECAALCAEYLKNSRGYVAHREAELKEMIRLLRDALAASSGDGAAFNAKVLSSVERVHGLTRIDDIVELKRTLSSEVSTLRRTVEEKQKRDKEEGARVHERLEVLRTKLMRAEQEALVDGLTRVANRSAFDRTLPHSIAEAITSSRPLALAMVDVDNFKTVNDSHGHAIGDRVLVCAANWLTKGVRRTDMVARYGGEEFAIVLHDSQIGDVEARLRVILADIAARSFEYDAGGQVRLVQFTVSCGVAELIAGDSVEDLIRRADDALYEAKRRGKNRVIARKRSMLGGLPS